jgi:hypothetical protein
MFERIMNNPCQNHGLVVMLIISVSFWKPKGGHTKKGTWETVTMIKAPMQLLEAPCSSSVALKPTKIEGYRS